MASDTDPESPRLASPLGAFLLVASAALALIAVALPIHQLTEPGAAATVNLTPAVSETALATVPLPEGQQIRPTGDDGLTVNLFVDRLPDGAPVPLALRLLTEFGTSIWLLGLATIAYLLARILANISAGDPFHPSHARRFTQVAIAILVASAGADTVNYLTAKWLTAVATPGADVTVLPYYSLIPIALAAVTLVLAGAFRAGRRIADDTEGLV